ncbi:MAG: porin [Myxococcota bacterium]
MRASKAALLGAVVLASIASADERFLLASGEGGELSASTRQGLAWEWRDLRVRLGGRFHLDAAIFDDDRTRLKNDLDVRRGRLQLRVRYGDDWRLRVDREFADESGSDSRGWRNVWLRWTPLRKVQLQVGNFIAPLGLESLGSSNTISFLERALPSVLAPGFQTGAMLAARGRLGDTRRRHHWTFAVFGGIEPFGVEENDTKRSEHVSFASRLTYAPWAENRRVLHLGAAVEYRDNDHRSRYRVRTRPESFLAEPLLSTGRLREVDEVTTFGAEAGGIYGPFSLQGEYLQSWLSRPSRSRSRPDPTFHGWYVQGSWVVTGESKRYSRSRGVFGGVRPKARWGAVELAVRVSALDLNDETVRGGSATDITLGANWYLRENVRLMFNYVNVESKQRRTRRSDDPHLFLFRFAVFL